MCIRDRVHGALVFIHDVDWQMGKVEVFQCDGADVVVVRDFDIVLIALTVCPRLCAVAHLDLHILGEDILPVKERLKKPLNLIQRKLPLVEGR